MVLKLCTGEVDDLSESDMEPFMEHDEDLPVKPAAEDRPVPQKSVEGPAPDVQPDAAKVNALPPEKTCMAVDHELRGRRQFEGL